MAFSFSTGLVHTLFNDASNGGKSLAEALKDGIIEIYGGNRPASADNAVTGTLLGTVTVGGGSFVAGSPGNGLQFGVASDRSIDKATDETWLFTAIASGQATWFRHKGNSVDAGGSSTTLARLDGSIGQFQGDATMTEINLVSGRTYSFNGAKFRWPGN